MPISLGELPMFAGLLPPAPPSSSTCRSGTSHRRHPSSAKDSVKLKGYLLHVLHKRGGPKARLLFSLGYRSDNPHSLESDLRTQHLSLDVNRTHENAYGVVYEIEGPIRTPGGRTVRFCSVWQIDTGTDVPRFITMYPR